MRIIELWNDNIVDFYFSFCKKAIQVPPTNDTSLSNQVWCIAFSPDGSQLLAVVGDAIVAYDTKTGEKVNNPIRGAHKNNIYCIAYTKDGKRFATGGSDCMVIVWKNNLQPEVKYTHQDSVQTLGFNPKSGQLFSAGSAEMILCMPETQSIEKFKNPGAIKTLCSSWSHDGLYLAVGLQSGSVMIKDKRLNDQVEIKRGGAVWCVEFSPLTNENVENLLIVGSWDQTIGFFNVSGKGVFPEKKIEFDPLSLSFFANGEFFVVGGSDRKVTLWTREGNYINTICERSEWVWTVCIKPKKMVVAVGGNNGGVAMYQLTALIVHGLFQERYAYRDVITDVVVQEMVTDQRVRIKCKELVKKISVYRDKLAVQLNERILVYSTDLITPDDEEPSNNNNEGELANPNSNNNNIADLKFKLLKKINKKVDCSLLVVTSSYIILCLEQKLQMLNFSGDLVREWILESLIRYIKVLGGPEKRETLLVGLKNGKVLKIFTDNSFPILLINQNVAIRCLDMSQSRRRLAVVDDNSNLTVYDMVTKESIFSEINVTSVAFNSDMDELLAYSGKGLLYIKTENFPATSQKMNGFVVGFKGAKLFVLHYLNMSTLDVPQTYSLLKYIEKKQFGMAYKLACLGITDQDFKLLGIESLKYGEIQIAKKCFIRTKDYQFLELALKYEKEYQNGQTNPVFLQAEVLAYQGKYESAANLYMQSGFPEYASRLFEDLQDFEKALEYIKKTGQGTDGIESRQRDIQKGQADMLQETDYRRAAKIYNSIGLYQNSIQLLIKKNDREGVAEVSRMLNKNDHLQLLYKCALYFKTQKLYEYAKEAYMKLGDQKALVELGIQFEQWDYALFLAKQQPEFMKILYLPYAEFLTKSDRFEDAIQVYKKLGRTDLTQKILSKLSENATVEARFSDASYYFWILAVEFLSNVKNALKPDGDDDHNLRKWEEFNRISNIYHAYSYIYEFVESPFQESSGMSYYITIFNAARFIISQQAADQLPVGVIEYLPFIFICLQVSKVYIYLALAKVSKILEAYKTARMCYEKLKTLKIPIEWTEEVELTNLLMRSKPFQDKDELQSICNRCMQQIPIICNENRCQSCKQPLMQSFVSFEALPLVEFQVTKNVTPQKFQELLYEEKDPHERERIRKLREKQRDYDDDGWTETQYGNEQTLQPGLKLDEDTPFCMKMNEVCEQQVANEQYIPIVLDEELIKTLHPEEVFAIDYTKYCPTMPIKYYKTMIPEISLEVCKKCCRFFILDEYEFEYLRKQCCVFCRAKENEASQF